MSSPFHAFLLKLASEHDREVNELRAEIKRLRNDTSSTRTERRESLGWSALTPPRSPRSALVGTDGAGTLIMPPHIFLEYDEAAGLQIEPNGPTTSALLMQDGLHSARSPRGGRWQLKEEGGVIAPAKTAVPGPEAPDAKDAQQRQHHHASQAQTPQSRQSAALAGAVVLAATLPEKVVGEDIATQLRGTAISPQQANALVQQSHQMKATSPTEFNVVDGVAFKQAGDLTPPTSENGTPIITPREKVLGYRAPQTFHQEWEVDKIHEVNDDEMTSLRSSNGKLLPPPLLQWGCLLKAVQEQIATFSQLPKIHDSWTNKTDFSPDAFKMFLNAANGLSERPEDAKLALSASHQTQASEKGDKQGFRHALYRRGQGLLTQVIMDPNSKLRVTWDVLGVLLLVHDLVMIPMSFFGTENFDNKYKDAAEVFDMLSAAFWTCDIFISLLTGYHNAEGFVEMRPSKVMLNYLRTWFPIDFCIVTVDLVTLSVGLQNQTDVFRMSKMMKFMRVIRLLRLMKMNKSVSEILERINSEYILTLVGLIKLVVLIILINHYIACFWYGLSQLPLDAGTPTWVTRVKEVKGDDVFDSVAFAYSTSLHWSLTQFTPASMEIFPMNVYERFFNVVIIICALVIFSSFVSSITNAMTQIRNINKQSFDMETKIRRYFSENNISHALASRVWHFVRQNRIVAARRLKVTEIPTLQLLPMRLRDDLQQEVFLPALKMHPLFRRYVSISGQTMKRRLCKKVIAEESLKSGQELKVLADGQHVKGKLEATVKKMIFVIFGVLEYHSNEGEEQYAQVTRGQWACEAAIWAQSAVLDGPLVGASGGCDILLLDVMTFHAIAKEDIESYAGLVRYAEIFMERFTNAFQDDQVENLLFNSPEVAEELAREAFDTNAPRAESLLRALVNDRSSTTSGGTEVAAMLKALRAGNPRPSTGSESEKSTQSKCSVLERCGPVV